MTHQAKPSPPQLVWHRRPTPLLAVAAGVIIAFGIVGSLVSENATHDQEIVEETPGATPAIPDSDAEIVTDIAQSGARWSEAATSLVRDYLDIDGTVEQWVADAGRHMPSLRSAIDDLHGRIGGIDDPGLAATLRAIATSYDDRYAALERLVAAVDDGDLAGAEAAMRAVDAAAVEGRRLATDLRSRLEPYFDDDLEAELHRRFEDLKRQVLGE